MATERQVQETVSQCVACMVFYFNSRKSRGIKTAITAEFQDVALLVTGWGLGASEIGDSLLRPIEDELVVRYGTVEGLKLSNEFAEVFNGLAGTGPVLTLTTA
ncbi:hypothetical protein V5E97_09605 [Singulisphaera sp. Ch08]|uniref:Uncharacterized protein n=1 Tax=Singulisphaera sp. Ch08 TaxID=3120278 RepID=A0AAU7CMY1_9BACT